MLRFGQINGRLCQGITRRELLRAGTVGALGLSLPQYLQLKARGAANDKPPRSIIFLWLWGGPSHLDTFDMKPGAPGDYRGPFRPIATNVPGMEICELFPKLARHADQFSLIRSLRHETNDHGLGGTVGLTGSMNGGISLGGINIPGALRPSHGAVVTRLRGFRADLPTFVSIGGPLNQGHHPIAGEGGGGLGSLYDPFRLDYDGETERVRIPDLEIAAGQTARTLGSRKQLLSQLDLAAGRIDTSRTVDRLGQFYHQAFSLLTAPKARRSFDLDAEPTEVRDAYGRFRFGQSCLLARRLVEAGVPFVQVNWSSDVESPEDDGDGGWDMHDRYFTVTQDRHGWMLDRALSTLLSDLEQRGLLDQTLIVAVGEFGRTPRINGRAGRDHWQHCYSGLVAGGGFPRGRVVGASDARGEFPANRPVTPGDLAMTCFHHLGIGTTDLTTANITPSGTAIEELL
jgi:hypothetical protein